MWSKGLVLGGGLVAGFLAVGMPADADPTWTAAGACSWDDAAETFEPQFAGELENVATSGAEHRVSCGLDTGESVASTTQDLYVYFYDGNNNANMEDSLYCAPYSCTMSGAVCWNANTKYSCSTSGGCTTHGSGYTGDNSLSFLNLDRDTWSAINLTCAIPYEDSGVRSYLKRMLLDQ